MPRDNKQYDSHWYRNPNNLVHRKDFDKAVQSLTRRVVALEKALKVSKKTAQKSTQNGGK